MLMIFKRQIIQRKEREMSYRGWLSRVKLLRSIIISCILIIFLVVVMRIFSTQGFAKTGTMEGYSYGWSNVVASPNTWATRASSPVKRSVPLVTHYHDKILAFGGFDGSTFHDNIDEYDPTTDTWETVSTMTIPDTIFGDGVATATNGKIYVLGKSMTGNSLFEYNPNTDTWTQRADMPTVRSETAMVAASDGKIYVIGGYNNGYLNTVEAYDPSTDTWKTRKNMPTRRSHLEAAEAGNGKIYAIGGYDRPYDFFVALATVEEYDPKTNTWTTRASMSLPRHDLGVVAADNGRIYAIGGGDKLLMGEYIVWADYDAVEEYNPAIDTWTVRSSMPTARAYLGVALASNGKIYAVGGQDRRDGPNKYYDTVEEYTPPGYTGPAFKIYLPVLLSDD
jgi:N-acetylneuraminic acid mutarotase